ncbi:glycosyltransferase [Hymenobacter actinosclerus]|uniref:Glycosyltransferase, catalytic subunit of cellulose synthase and poly-beta-1,6-N-acetylglucosamine synthase n=1 Tax=Hymenobacter actinosclerus TaxID=82805 RepID=A0A1I0ADQ1_9BACT|nr:glycosyltransferase [Hymenobacter actinosclerus]SES91900.1 Glycosyltransferase, catalytic subunit of cellulose synthase and poly-beta-1,6-N-acetylglucosamine synthase [Hymenobacter actinosclerus]
MLLSYSPAVWLLLAAVLVQLYFALYYFRAFAMRRPDPETPVPADQPVSVLVCARNEYTNLTRLLPLLLSQDYPAELLEIILIDDRSTDGTGALAARFPGVRLVNIRSTPAGLAPKKYALTLGIKTARHERLLFTDADCIPATNQWVRYMQRGFAEGAGLVLGYSAYAPERGFLNKLVRFETLLTGAQYLSFAWRGRPYMGVGRNLGYTRAVFRSTKGFASHIRTLSGDDDLLVQDAVAAGARAAVVARPGAHTLSEAAATWAAWWRQKRRHLSAGKQYRLADRVRLATFIGANLLYYGAAVGLLFSPINWVPLAVICLMRTVLMGAVYQQLNRRLEGQLPAAALPLLDAAYFVTYLALGISLFLNRSLRWK